MPEIDAPKKAWPLPMRVPVPATLVSNGPLTVGVAWSPKLVKVNGTSMVHHFDVEKRFGSAVYASVAYPTRTGRWEERTVPFRIIPRERVLLVTATPQRSEASPLTEDSYDVHDDVHDHLT